MSVRLKVGPRSFEVGQDTLLHAFFSTVSHRLEPRGWGTRFPHLLDELYQGALPVSHLGSALTELKEIGNELLEFPPSDVVWDIENLDRQPPWGSNISPHITSLANYFVTSDGKDLVSVMHSALTWGLETGFDVTISAD